MKKYTIFGICCAALLLSPVSIYAQEGFTGPTIPAHARAANAGATYQAATVAQLPALTKNAWVILTGTLVNSTRRNYYTFRDATGEIIVEIERKYWGGLTVGPNDRIQIYGKLDRKRDGRIEVDAAIVRRL